MRQLSLPIDTQTLTLDSKVRLENGAGRLQLLKQLVYSHRITFSSNVSDSLL